MTPRRRTLRRLTWDGPYPQPGQFVASGKIGVLMQITAVAVHRTAPGQDKCVTLQIQRWDGFAPSGAVVHPHARLHPSEPTGPSRIRQISGSGPNAVMKAAWRDPSDTIPNAARRPRQITGYRTYCPLRRMQTARGSQITDAQIIAADLFRADADLAALGATPNRDIVGGAPAYGPKDGPSAVAMLQAHASIAVRRVLARFAPGQRLMLVEILLLNRSLQRWCDQIATPAPAPAPNPQLEMGKLLAVLDVLVDAYRDSVAQFAATEALVSSA